MVSTKPPRKFELRFTNGDTHLYYGGHRSLNASGADTTPVEADALRMTHSDARRRQRLLAQSGRPFEICEAPN